VVLSAVAGIAVLAMAVYVAVSLQRTVARLSSARNTLTAVIARLRQEAVASGPGDEFVAPPDIRGAQSRSGPPDGRGDQAAPATAGERLAALEETAGKLHDEFEERLARALQSAIERLQRRMEELRATQYFSSARPPGTVTPSPEPDPRDRPR